MKFCSQCGSREIQFIIPSGDNRPRHCCPICKEIHYQNPRMICGTIPTYDNKILLCKRAIEPQKGFWTLPAGFMENGETTEEAAIRETREEAEADIKIEGIYTIFNLPHINQVYFFFRGEVKDGIYGVGIESLDSQLFSPEEIPWDELAFRTVKRSIELFLEDKPKGNFPFRMESFYHK